MRINISIANINKNEENYNTAIEYALNAIKYKNTVDNKGIIASCFITISAIYGQQNKEDSAIFYAEKCLPLTKYMYAKQEAFVYVNIAAYTINTDTAKSKKYALKAIKTNPNNNAYQILADLASKNNDYE